MSLDRPRARRAHRLHARLALAILFAVAAAPLSTTALAQTGDTQAAPAKKPAKKKPKPKPKAAPVDEAPAETTPPPAPAPTPPPADTAPAEPAPAPSAPAPAESAAPEGDLAPITDVTEKPAKTYYFVGVRYRGTIVPKFMMNLFVDEGATVYSNSIGLELDIRRDDFSMIPSITYTSYGFGDTLFRQKGTDASSEYNYSDINSGLNAIYIAADVLWSKKISTNFAFEYGAGFGIGAIFGSLKDSWVYASSSGQLTGSNGQTYAPCTATNSTPNSGCNPASHTNPSPAKILGYSDPNWLNGGSVPVVFPEIVLPELGVRYKPIKEVEARLVIGFSLAGPFFGISADYGLESRKPDDPKPSTTH